MFSIVNIKMSQTKMGQNILSLIKLSVLSGLFLCGCFFLDNWVYSFAENSHTWRA